MKLKIWLPILVCITMALWLSGCAAPAATPMAAPAAAPAAPAIAAQEADKATEPLPVEAAPAAAPAPSDTGLAASEPSDSEQQADHLPLATTAPTLVQNEKSTDTQNGTMPSTFLPTATALAPLAMPVGEQPAAAETPAESQLEKRMLEMEYPLEIQLGDSDLIRLALVPYEDHYQVTTEFPEHVVQTQTVPIQRPAGYQLKGVARLDAAGFDISPKGEQESLLPAGKTVSWRWSLTPRQTGRQRLSLVLLLRWEPENGVAGPVRQVEALSRGLEINVVSFLGLTRPQAYLTGFAGLFLGGLASLSALIGGRRKTRRFNWRVLWENPQVQIEPLPGLQLNPMEAGLLRAMFNRYRRLVIDHEFFSGYSGARTFLVKPVLASGQADAASIVKMGSRRSIQTEFENYEAYVKDRLPPLTARIQQPPMTVHNSPSAAIQYTFISEPGRPPVSLRQVLLDNPDPAILQRLFDSFGPNWWLQRQPAVFRWGEAYDCLLPPHAVLKPLSGLHGQAKPIGENTTPSSMELSNDQVVLLTPFKDFEPRADGISLTLIGQPQPGEPAIRLRWSSADAPKQPVYARVEATRADLWKGLVNGLTLERQPDPLLKLPGLLYRSVPASRSVIHGDLNLENVLVGPGGFVWLIDFARTRTGHPLFDFAHLQAEIISHIITPRNMKPAVYLKMLADQQDPLLNTVESLAGRLLFNPSDPSEFRISSALACLGALKYGASTPEARQLLYLTAAYYLS